MRRIQLFLTLVVVGSLVMTTAACESRSPAGELAGSAAPREPAAQAPPAPVAAVAYAPAAGATAIPVRRPATVTVSDGTLTAASLTNAKGEAVEGGFNADRTSWSTTEPLGYGGTYTWSGSATGSDGVPFPLAGSFATVKPKNVGRGRMNGACGRPV